MESIVISVGLISLGIAIFFVMLEVLTDWDIFMYAAAVFSVITVLCLVTLLVYVGIDIFKGDVNVSDIDTNSVIIPIPMIY